MKLPCCTLLVGIIAFATSLPAQTAGAIITTSFAASAAFTEFRPVVDPAKHGAFERYRILPCEFLRAGPALTPIAPSEFDLDRTTRQTLWSEVSEQDLACTDTGASSKYHLAATFPFRPAVFTGAEHLAAWDPSGNAPSFLPPESEENFGFSAALSAENSNQQREGFHWWPALEQSFNFLVLEHGFRIASDPFLRYLLWHKPFWHDWAASNQHFYFNQWGDGDDFIVNYIGHPLEGSVTGNIQIVNDPRGRSLTFGRSRAYWMSRMRAMAWAAVYSAQFEAGPILSESAIGNEGGYFYKPGCDPGLSCSTGSKKPITNNTGWVDFVVTPLVGTGWIVLEDAIEAELTSRFAPNEPDEALKWKMMRAALSPSHVMANFVAGKVPWYRYRIYGPDGGNILFGDRFKDRPKFTFDGVQRWELGVHYTYLSLPVDTETCVSCRVSNSGFGGNFAYRLTNRLWVDSDVNYFPGSGGFGSKGSMVQGMFGPRYGYTGKSWAWYFKLRPGFIYYDKTLTAESGSTFTEATRFAFDVGSVFEWFTSRHSAIRFDAGTTVVRYLTGRDDPRQPPGNILSTDYIVAQSNFQFSTGYTYRF